MTTINPDLDLVVDREVDVPPAAVWSAWTDPEQMVHWFTPAPWGTRSVELDLRPGGDFHVVMSDPDGNEIDQGHGCVLEVVENERFTWTSALGPDFRPQPGEMSFTATILVEPAGGGTRYRAIARHATAEDKQAHENMGFIDGWSAVLDQLVAYVKSR